MCEVDIYYATRVCREFGLPEFMSPTSAVTCIKDLFNRNYEVGFAKTNWADPNIRTTLEKAMALAGNLFEGGARLDKEQSQESTLSGMGQRPKKVYSEPQITKDITASPRRSSLGHTASRDEKQTKKVT